MPPSQTDHETPLLKSTLLTFSFLILSGLSGFLLRIFYVRILPQDVFGMFNALLFFAPIILYLSTLGFHDALSYFTPQMHAQARSRFFSQVFSFILLSDSVLLFLLLLSFPFIRHQYLHVSTIPLILSAALFTFFFFQPLLYFLMDVWRSIKVEYYYTLIEGIRVFSILIGSVLIFLLTHDPLRVFLVWILIHPLLFLFFLKRLSLFNVHLHLESPFTPELFSKLGYSSMMGVSGFILHMLFNVDIFFLTLLQGVSTVAIYAALLPFAGILLLLSRTGTIILLPRASSKSIPQDRLNTVLFAFLLFLSVAFFTLLFLLPSFLPLFLPSYAQQPHLLIFLLSAAFAVSIALILTTLLAAYGYMRERLVLTILTLFTNLIFTPILINIWGMRGAAYATLLSAIFLSALSLLLLWKRSIRLFTLIPPVVLLIIFPFIPSLSVFLLILALFLQGISLVRKDGLSFFS